MNITKDKKGTSTLYIYKFTVVSRILQVFHIIRFIIYLDFFLSNLCVFSIRVILCHQDRRFILLVLTTLHRNDKVKTLLFVKICVRTMYILDKLRILNTSCSQNLIPTFLDLRRYFCHFPFIPIFLHHSPPTHTHRRTPPLPPHTPLPCGAVTFLHPLSPY